MAASSDIQRLVYPPKVWAFTKDATGNVHNLTDYIVGGEVKRKISQVSSFTLRLRNPEMIFTTRGKKYATFHPMDPITIFMERIPGKHVQVFTGFLDSTPYLQLIPGVITLQGSCTLKRLQFNWFQFAQQYTLAFFEHFGWKVKENGTLSPVQGGEVESSLEALQKKKWEEEAKSGKITTTDAHTKIAKEEKRREKTSEQTGQEIGEGKSKKPATIPFASGGIGKGALSSNDGSFKKMLWAFLYYVADWKDENIYIEAVPDSVPKLITTLWANFEKGQEAAREETEAFWAALIGTSAEGSGGVEIGKGIGKTGEIKDVSKIIPIMVSIANRIGVPPAFVITTALCESSLNPNDVGSEGATGYFQYYGSEPYPGVKGSPEELKKRSKDLGQSTEDFCKAALAKGHSMTGGKGLPSEGEWEVWAKNTQVSIGYPGWTTELAHAKQLMSQHAPTGAPLKGGIASEPEEKQRGGKAEKSNTGGSNSYAAYHNPFEKCKGVVGGRADMGADYHTASGGEPIVAIADSRYVTEVSGWPAGNALVFQVTQDGPLHGVYIYYAESIAIMSQIKQRGSVKAGEPFATTTSSVSGTGTGLEFGYAAANGDTLGKEEWHESEGNTTPTKYGLMFARLMIKLGAPIPSTGHPGDGPVVPGGKHEVVETGTGGEAAGGSSGESSMFSTATAASFISQISAPTELERRKANLGGQRSLMNVSTVLSMVQQICKASLREFMSLPNGDFYAFHPDYFGEFGHRQPYWEIHNIEILSGEIGLSDENLVTHAFAIGNTTWPADEPFLNEASSGIMTIAEAFTPGILLNHDPTSAKQDIEAAVAFLRRYGARPLKLEYPMVFSTLFEQLLAYQQFLLAWSRQFRSVFKFTFMPELFPGGRVAFPEHGLQMYIEEVIHTWDLEGGFQTIATLTAPSVFRAPGNQSAIDELPPRMVEALIEPQRGQVAGKAPEKQRVIPQKTETPDEMRKHGEAFGPGLDSTGSNSNQFEKDVFG